MPVVSHHVRVDKEGCLKGSDEGIEVSHPEICNDVHIECRARNAVQRSGQRTTHHILDLQPFQNAGHGEGHLDGLGDCHRQSGGVFRIPAEGTHHGRSINTHRCEPQHRFTLVDARVALSNSCEGKLANIVSQGTRELELLGRRHLPSCVRGHSRESCTQ